MAILVAGGAGYIGSHTCVELLNRGFEVVVVDNLYNSSEVALERVQQITGKTLKFYKGDLLNREDLEPILRRRDRGGHQFCGTQSGWRVCCKTVGILSQQYYRYVDPLRCDAQAWL